MLLRDVIGEFLMRCMLLLKVLRNQMLLRDVILCNGGMMRKFIKITFQQGELGTKSELGGLSWSQLVWFTQRVPRHAFIIWLAFRDRHSTCVRMRQWEITQGCMFCGERDETRDYLFFACPITYIHNLDYINGESFGHCCIT